MDIETLLEQHAGKDLLRFITCGSVDDGKSTLIGRLLLESQQVYEDQLDAVRRDSKKWGTQGDEADLALLVDGLQSEREQGITIDVAYRYFSTPKRKFIIADTPGHEQYTRNMATGASTADAAVILIDARHGLQTQTRRHSYIVSLLGIRQVVVAVNKMDLIDFDQARFEAIEADYRAFANKLDMTGVQVLPVSALGGDNVLERGPNLDWYEGATLLELLESLPAQDEAASRDFRLPVQYVNRHSASFRGFAGTVASGTIAVDEAVMVMPAGRQSRVKRIVTQDGDLASARAGQAITLELADEIDISRGDMLVRPDARPRVASGLDARLVWMVDTPLNPGRQYDLRFSSATVPATPELIHHRVDVNTLEHQHAEQLGLNDTGLVRWRLSQPTAFDAYSEHRPTGAFVVIDRISNLTVGAGMIVRPVTDSLADKSSNVVWHEHRIAKSQRAGQKSQRPAVLWFTGLSGAGKSSVANALEQALFQRGHHSYLLDGDNVRHGLNRDLGFTDEDRVENIRRIGEVARLMADAGLVVLSAFISPFRADRAMVRELMEPGEFVEIHVHASLETCESRDPKGLYAKARAGTIRHFTGIDSPYEAPEHPEVVLDTEKHSVEECVDLLLDYLRGRQILV
ncbi:sulfate adenylyltransferase subunit CysN [Wenzhouxiangella marina]|uniref:Multifunctional fusion protein n=1 Tax=Wenzhouxiangella marina TaxID=1579979 RepID=A0A0K0XT93_9GAMM|nr:sulfate adenylyltransferase subunit CysN [Wenzhouxiangella marina]AKS40908.1 Bifunctional enzyme nodQ [Wenzhouxiangella marina]MBB6087782.1 bifunctional enzyme CysN/CysC [Wenzhouxiangella marina]